MPIAQPFHRSRTVHAPPAAAPINSDINAVYKGFASPFERRGVCRGGHYTEAPRSATVDF